MNQLFALGLTCAIVQICSHVPGAYGQYSGLTGEALYKSMLKALAVDSAAVDQAVAANTAVTNPGPFLSDLRAIVTADNALLNVINGTNAPTGQACLTAIHSLGIAIRAAKNNGNDTIPAGPLTGEPFFQSVLQKLGSDLNLLTATAVANVNTPNPGPFLAQVVQLNAAIIAVQTIDADNDTSAACPAANLALAKAFFALLSIN